MKEHEKFGKLSEHGSHFDQEACDIAEETGLQLDKKIYQANYYTADRPRNVIYSGRYEEKPAILKIYDDPRITDEPISLESFHKVNTSKRVTAPELYRYKVHSPNRGWMITEGLFENGDFFHSPISSGEKKEFLDVYRDYRANFPEQPTRLLTVTESLPAPLYYEHRIARWMQLANVADVARRIRGDETFLSAAEFVPRFEKTINIINRVFRNRKMIWSHGHFKPKEIFKKTDGSMYYITDFAHTSVFPEGHEQAFMIWADRMTTTNIPVGYEDWKKGINEWITAFKQADVYPGDALMHANLLERCMGTMLADITASDMSAENKKGQLELFYRFVDELLE